jgi:hypothetical protein
MSALNAVGYAYAAFLVALSAIFIVLAVRLWRAK